MNRIPAASLLLVALFAMPAAVLAKASDRNQPIDVDAGSSDCSVSDERLPCLLTSGVTKRTRQAAGAAPASRPGQGGKG